MYNNTPRLRSAFPQTPQQTPPYRQPRDNHSPGRTRRPEFVKPLVPTPVPRANQPLISFDLLDAPTQRLLIVSAYGILTAFRLLDYWKESDDLDSTWLFLKWVLIDFASLFILPTFRIPWLEWGFSTTVAVFLLHAVMDMFLMFHIPIPVGVWISALVKLIYNRELSISERRVNPSEIKHNASIILGKQIIQILPEGSAVLNPERLPFCLDSTVTSIELPIRVNQTTPTLIELLRIDLETDETELITIAAKQAKSLKKQAEKHLSKNDVNSPRTLQLPVKKPGVYKLQRVVDESKLEVQKRAFDTVIPQCPQASIVTDTKDKCVGEVSNLELKVSGLAPFRVKYSKAINNQESSSHFQNVQPDDFSSPLNMQQPSNSLVMARDQALDWAKRTDVSVPINEVMSTGGTWSYTVEEVQDASGNIIVYKARPDSSGSRRSISALQQQDIWVHERPKMSFRGCDGQSPLKAPEKEQVDFPVDIGHLHGIAEDETPLTVEYTYSSTADEDTNPRPAQKVSIARHKVIPTIREPGLYSLQSVQSKYCSGTIIEPASCMLVNPPRPDMSVESEDITDNCAGNAIGTSVDLEFTGTPPFQLRYTVLHDGQIQPKIKRFEGSRGHLELVPTTAGSYVYELRDLSDAVYGAVSLKDKGYLFNLNVKPPASASFASPIHDDKICLGSPFTTLVSLIGEAPWDLDYEIIHQGKRRKHSVKSETERLDLRTEELTQGGRYSLALTSIKDNSGCKRSLNEEMSFEVRSDQARAKFGDVDGKVSVVALEGKSVDIPVRLQGVKPWAVTVVNEDPRHATSKLHILKDRNSVITVNQPGRYIVKEVKDSCPGLVDESANAFDVSWVDRPSLDVKESNISKEGERDFRKDAVCEGDEDQLQLSMTGSPPFEIAYTQQQGPSRGSGFLHNKKLSSAVGSATVYMDTSKAGENVYKFVSLSDNLYQHDSKKSSPLIVRQTINSLPAAQFQSPGKTYSYCTNDASGSEVVPLVLEGKPPFSVEIGVTHHGSARPEIVKLKAPTNRYEWSLSRRDLHLGTHSISIRKVQDSRGCERTIDHDPSSVRVMVSDVPSITPLETQTDYCVGEHISFSLSGLPPFEIFYRFQDVNRKATIASSSKPIFRRIAEQPGDFTITALSDNASGKCRAEKDITKQIHPMPSVKISKGHTSVIDIHEGGDAELLFEFTGTPPFEFTYTRSGYADSASSILNQQAGNPNIETNDRSKSNKNKAASSQRKAKSGKPIVLETHTEVSHEFEKRIRASDAGIYEVTSIRDRYCSFSLDKGGGFGSSGSSGAKVLEGGPEQKKLQN